MIYILFIVAGMTAAQVTPVEDEFNPLLTREAGTTAENASGNVLIQPDGKIIITAFYSNSSSVTARYFLRLNADGTIDNTFNCTICADTSLNDPQLLPDGRILAQTAAAIGDGTSRVRLIYLNSNGSLNNSIVTSIQTGLGPGALPINNIIWAVRDDGKIYLETIRVQPGSTFRTLSRLNPDGSVDSSFQQIGTSSRTFRLVSDIALLPDGKFFISGDNYSVARFNDNGTLDTSFDAQQLTCSSCMIGGAPGVYNFALQPADGKIVIGGNFNSVNGVPRIGLARLHPASNVDLDFNPSLPFATPSLPSVSRVEITPDNKIIVQGNFAGGVQLLRLKPDGSIDDTFAAPTNINFLNWKLDSLGRVVFFGRFSGSNYKFGRLNPNGSLETTFTLPGAKGAVSTIARQSDGKIIIAGDFERINGVARNKIARLNADGSLDASFDAGSGFNLTPVALVVQPDGKILAGGAFTGVNGSTQVYLARLNSDGTLDAAFNPTLDTSVSAIALQADGKILIGGTFNSVGGASRSKFARLNSDGSLDTAFNPLMGGATEIRTIVVEPDGKIVIGGSFTSINGFARSNMARLNADGSLDASFNAGSIATPKIIIRQPADGKYLILTSNSADASVIRRLNNGSVDASFTGTSVSVSSGFAINALALRPDGSIVIGGFFNSIQGFTRRNIARLLPNGALDQAYLLTGADGEVKVLQAQPDGKVLVGGFIMNIENVSRAGLARLNNAPVLASLPDFDFNGDGRADLSVFRPSTGFWYIARPTGVPSQNFDGVQFGANGDLTVPADYDGDGTTDIAVWRPSEGTWYLKQSTAGFRAAQFGASGDIPVPGDFDGDGKANLAVFRPSTGSWYIARATGIPSQNFDTIPFGANGDKPIAGSDFDGDGRADVCVYRPSDGNWYRINSSTNQFVGIHFGVAEDKPVAADYDGDGKTDLAVFRPSDGVWYRINSQTDSFSATQFGISSDRPAPADYDGDGKSDLAVFRPAEGNWYILRSTQGYTGFQFGAQGDVPPPNSFVR